MTHYPARQAFIVTVALLAGIATLTGHYFDVYDMHLLADVLLHTLGGICVGGFLFLVFEELGARGKWHSLYVVTWTFAAAVVWEVIEYSILGWTKGVPWKFYVEDTGFDISTVLLGAILLLFIGAFIKRKEKRVFDVEAVIEQHHDDDE